MEKKGREEGKGGREEKICTKILRAPPPPV